MIDRADDRGPAQGLAEAIGHGVTLGCTGVLVTPVDVPDLTDEDLRRLIEAFGRNPTQIVCAVDRVGLDDASRAGEVRLQPLVAVYPVGVGETVERLAASPHRGLYRWIRSLPHQTVEMPSGSLRNVNRPEDLDS